MRTRAALLLVVLAVAGCGAPATTSQPASPASAPVVEAPAGQPPASQPVANLPPADPGHSPAVGGDAGIRGITVVRSGCPMARTEPACPENPVAALLAVMRTSDGATVSKVQSDASGQFVVTVPPGSYLLRPIGLVGGPGHDSLPMDITVEPGRYTSVTVLVDSGLR